MRLIMIPLVPVLLFALLSPGQDDDDPYHIKGTIESAKDKNDATVLRIKGTTNLPDGTTLTIHVYYTRMVLGKHLGYRAVRVKEGAFTMDFSLYRETNLPGLHLAHIRFSPFSQQNAVRKAMGNDLRPYEFTAKLTIGSEKDIDNAREAVHRRLAAEIKKLADLAVEIDKAFNASLKDRDKAAWDKKAAAWRNAIHGVQKRCFNIPEYRALDIADIAEAILEQLTRGVFRMIQACSAALSGKTRDPNIFDAIASHLTFVTRVARKCYIRLGLEKGSAEEVRDEVVKLVKILNRVKDFFRSIGSGGTNPEGFMVNDLEFRKLYQKTIFRLNRISPDDLREQITALARAGNKVVQLLRDAVKKRKGDDKALEAALADVKIASDAFLKGLEKGPKRQGEPEGDDK